MRTVLLCGYVNVYARCCIHWGGGGPLALRTELAGLVRQVFLRRLGLWLQCEGPAYGSLAVPRLVLALPFAAGLSGKSRLHQAATSAAVKEELLGLRSIERHHIWLRMLPLAEHIS